MSQPITTAAQVGIIFRARRRALRLSQQEVASKLAVSQGRLSTLEADPTSLPLERLLAWAHLLGLELRVQEKKPDASASEDW